MRIILLDFKLVIDGIIIMSENFRDALDNMFDVRIFIIWKKIFWELVIFGFWFIDFLDRN